MAREDGVIDDEEYPGYNSVDGNVKAFTMPEWVHPAIWLG